MTKFLTLFLSTLLLSVTSNALPQTENPPTIIELTIPSHGSRMSGIAYLADGAGPHPTIMLLHGYPGNEKNLDVAQAMRSKGWNVVFFHYRGSWGSEGEFSFGGSEEDVNVVYSYITDATNAKNLRINTDRISIVGHSMGGHMALAGIYSNAGLKCAIAYDGANIGAGLGDNPETTKIWYDYADSLFMLKGWSGDKATKEVTEHGKALNLIPRAHKINGRPVMLISANSSVIPEATRILPIYKALKATPNSKVKFIRIEDDHSFNASRDKLIDLTADFLNGSCR